jgi:hypothetical protein
MIRKIKILDCLAFFFLLLASWPVSGWAAPGIKITQPDNGTVVTPGQVVDVTVDAVGGFVCADGMIVANNFFDSQFSALPANFNITIPKGDYPSMQIMAVAKDQNNNFVSDNATLAYQHGAALQSIRVTPDSWYFETDWNGNSIQGDVRNLAVKGKYSDGVNRDLTANGSIFSSDNPAVALVDANGKVQPVSVGTANISIANSGYSFQVPITVSKPSGPARSETIPPTTTMNIQPADSSGGWYSNDASVTLTATDNPGGSGMGKITYIIDKNPPASMPGDTAQFQIAGEGQHKFIFAAMDNAGNEESAHYVDINIDKILPAVVITSPQEGKDYPAGQDIALTYEATDSLSGIDSKVVTLDGLDVSSQDSLKPTAGKHTLVVTAKDKASNTATKQITFKVIENKIKTNVTIKPEVFLRNRGVFIALVRLPAPYNKEKIVSASCDGASAKRIISLKNVSLFIFRRQDITQLPIDTTFFVTGKLANGMSFEGTDTIRKVIGAANPNPKDKKGEQDEISQCCRDNGLDCGRDVEDND